MPQTASLCAVAVALLSALPAAQAGMYPKSSPVLQVTAKDYDRLVAKSNYTTILEFYAPWCGHCQNLKPAYEKAAKSLDGLAARAAAIDCDDDVNKPLCGQMGIKGFPTLKIVRPGKKPGKPAVEEYQGPRSAKGIVEAVVDKINNHVTRLADKDVDAFLEGDKPKAILFTEKGTTTPLIKSLAIDFLDVISVAQVRNTQAKAVEKFGIEKFPTLVLIPAGEETPVVYDGEMKKAGMTKFLSQAGSPNPDPAPAGAKKRAKKDAKKEAKKDTKEPKKESPKPAAESPAATDDAEPSEATEAVKPSPPVEKPSQIITATTPEELDAHCLVEKSPLCLVIFEGESSVELGKQLDEIAARSGGRKKMPMVAVTKGNTRGEWLRKQLGVSADVQIIATNVRRGWWTPYAGQSTQVEIEAWIDKIKMGENEKKKIPEGVEQPAKAAAEEKVEEKKETKGTDPEPEVKTETEHDEL